MSYNGAVLTRLATPWTTSVLGPNGLPVGGMGVDLDAMRNRSRSLERNNALASGVLDRVDENIIGTGIRLRANTDDTTFNDKANDLWRRKIEGKLFDVRRMYSFDEMQGLVYRSTHRDGDVAIILVDRGAGPEIQLLEGDFIRNPSTSYDRRIVDGVEFSETGAPIAYWVEEYSTVGTSKPRRILARDIIFLHRSKRYNVSRGEPSFHAQYTLFDQIVAVMEAVVVAMRIGASQALIAKLKRPGSGMGNRTQSLVVNAEGRPVRGQVIEPGMINFIYNDEDITGFNPTQPQANFADAIRTFARFVGLKFGLTLERVMLDFSKANYSVSRSTALQEQRTSEKEQWMFDKNVFARLWPWFIQKSINRGDLVGPVPDEPWRYDWQPNGRPLVEPSKDAPGLKVLVDMGLPPQYVFQEMGYYTEQICKDSAEWVRLRKENGNLPPFGFTAETANAGTAPVEPGDRPDPDDDDDDKDDPEDGDR